MATIVRTTGETLSLSDLSLASLQLAVGGYIEAVTTHDNCTMYINEEGKRQGLPVNRAATSRYRHGRYDSIVGDVVVLTAEETCAEQEQLFPLDLDEEDAFLPGNPAEYGDST